MEQITREEMIGLLREHQQLLVRHGHPLIEVIRAENAITALQAAEPVGIVVDNCGKNFVNWRGETPWLDSAKPGMELFTLPCPPAKVSHWSFENPGRADQYRAEALAARRALGFKEGADDVAPADLEDAINALRQPATELAPESWREELETIAEILEADGDEWNCAARIRKMLTASPAPEQHPDDVAVDLFAAAMKSKLAQKRREGRGGWNDKEQCSQQYLSYLLYEHVEKGDPVDVGNFAMMLHQRGENILLAPDHIGEDNEMADALYKLANLILEKGSFRFSDWLWSDVHIPGIRAAAQYLAARGQQEEAER